MSLEWLTGIVLALAAVVASARLLNRHARRDRAQPSRLARLAVLLLAQPLLAALLYFGLFPPLRPAVDNVMTVLTAGAQSATRASGELHIALPEATMPNDAEAAPDLATALRRHSQIEQLHVIGGGLEARDMDAARGYPLTFTGASPPAGLVEVDAPAQVVVGNAFVVNGRIAGLQGATVELVDPAGQRVRRATPGADGRFTLQGAVRAAGAATFSLRVHASDNAVGETLPLPINVIAPAPLRLLVLSGAPGPELKYLRRWASDAGIALHTRIDVGAGLSLGDTPVSLDALTLRGFDAVLLDARSLRSLDDDEMRALDAAVREGLGLVLRLGSTLPARERARLRALGFDADAGADTVVTRLPEADAAGSDVSMPSLTRRALRVQAPDAVTLLRDAQGQSLTIWRAQGRGRIALMLLLDSYKLTLAGHAPRHAELWSTTFAAIARTERTPSLPSPPWPLWQGERAVFCGLANQVEVVAPDQARTPLAVDPAGGARRCAAFWPTQPGWHRLRQNDAQLSFAVLPANVGVAWQAQRRFDATAALAAQSSAAVSASVEELQRGPAWPWLGAWLALAVLTWVLERWRTPPSKLPEDRTVGAGSLR